MTKKREGHTKKRHKNDNNKYGKKENSDKVEQENQKEKKIPKEHTPFLTTCYRYIKGSCVFLVTLPLKPFKIAYMIMICIWTNFCAFCGRFTKMFSFRRTKSEERMGNQEESADVKTRSESQKNTQKVKVLEQEKRQFSKSTKDSNGKLNLMEEEKETTLKRLTEYEEKLKTMESQKNSSLNRIKEIEAQLNSTDKEKNSALEKVKDIKQKLKTAESDKGDALKKIKEFEANMKSTEKEKTSALQRIKECEAKLNSTEKDKTSALKRIKEVEVKLNSTEKEKTSALQRVREFEQKLKATESDKEDALKKLREYQSANVYLQTENKNGLERLTEAEKCVRLLTQEKSDALTRLSDIMGTKLRDNNPAITDLNDPNRPMKLGDQFSELYENEWTDAFSDIVDCKNLNLTEIETIAVLLDMLKEVYNICLEDIEEQLSGHKKLVHGFSDDEIEPFLKTAKESVKTNAANYIPLLYRKITSSTSTCKTVVQYKDFSLPYIENCVKICYFAAVQNPPMVIDFEPGQIFDKQSYIEYTRSGTIVEYSVWPVLYLHKGGPILSKGVVQPKDESNSNN
ncbi:thyroid receptor-interacting protein 11-like isoform X7 [Mytilus californianus]|uniref:thyroid receptor-interacting protein 11-like isoform X7 n=1 Tax=Mytilus californianus TaxID=6549 RepID=UPI00224778E1|nr:thyroid receptor-interacting protein 11-like isoform X7 [Mytilus californianus]